MITLIDRADGTPLSELSPEDFTILQDQLVLESEQDFDYYLNDGTLELLAEAGVSAQVISAISARMRHRGLDVGWEHSAKDGEMLYTGRVVDVEVVAVGGIRVDLLKDSQVVAWAYSRNDGTFAVSSDALLEDLYLRFSGRGDLILTQIAVGTGGEQGQVELQTLYGQVLTNDDKPLAGVNVMLTDWESSEERDNSAWQDLGGRRSWGDTDDEGCFSIPVSLPEDLGPLELKLELATVAGQDLETVVRTFTPGDGFDLGVLRAPEPAEPVFEEALPVDALTFE